MYVQQNILLTREKDEGESGEDPMAVREAVGVARRGPNDGR
jgi:hypothetical protein